MGVSVSKLRQYRKKKWKDYHKKYNKAYKARKKSEVEQCGNETYKSGFLAICVREKGHSGSHRHRVR